MSVKVGQIYFNKRLEVKLVITFVSEDLCDWVTEKGKTCTDKCDWISLTSELVTEYKTWQEAINSPEFLGGTKENA